MATILYITSYGTDDPTRATLPFVGALGALDAGHQPQITLMGDAAALMKDTLVDHVHGVGWPPLKELMEKIHAGGVPIFV